MTWVGDRQPQPYRRESAMTMPVHAPDEPEPDDDAEEVTGMDGKPRSRDYFRTSLGLPPRGQASREDSMPWRDALSDLHRPRA